MQVGTGGEGSIPGEGRRRVSVGAIARQAAPTRTWEALAALPLEVESYGLDRLERAVSSDFTRVTTVVRLRGRGEEGIGEDVTYDPEDQDAQQRAGPYLPLSGRHTLEGFSTLLDELDLFPAPPDRDVYRLYRRWAYESAALDLALRQAGLSLAEALGRTPRPVSFVVSLRLGEPPSADPVLRRLELYPNLRFKLDPTSSWTDELVDELRATGAIDSFDFKGRYTGTIVDQPPDPELYERVVRAFPDAWLEDPALTEETERVLAPHVDRVTWDEPIHSVADIEALPFPPRMVNVKPSRFGALRALLETYAFCEERGIGIYGGGQFELGPGRGQIQYLASLFHPDTPNDVAPTGFHASEPGPGLQTSPLAPAIAPAGFRWLS
jgi:L-alanine-DL-glutamate epimerase-like enolase superfamily enzyme